MLRKLQLISEKLEPGRTDIWECEMLYKLVNRELDDPYTINYLNEKFTNPYKAFHSLIKRLLNEAS